mgnify:CR=1 FL=1
MMDSYLVWTVCCAVASSNSCFSPSAKRKKPEWSSPLCVDQEEVAMCSPYLSLSALGTNDE